jgi:hypothetical protein
MIGNADYDPDFTSNHLIDNVYALYHMIERLHTIGHAQKHVRSTRQMIHQLKPFQITNFYFYCLYFTESHNILSKEQRWK